ncbi:Os08g0395500 [Oryza sativa Japonica Group]|uniref:Os08g0395500 protein n=2 Tax=Oryza sativa subsp. japonica TaxID=39947 RepID=A0A0P0XFG6_ORYSJ|nr:hypothetical protein OsJ_27195 [Oryza sativa Japonica Group]KAB8108417.1 hypothetical protein EE612_044080 [Oryza sativa]BAD05210.1 unknown protein [Oryza sativa Japonica Group]BAF23649.1 Os08g0395500 [Oryza sativa Japonica Group]BAG97919.1 unnamed protein product [Oryza sativa Japonica Group]|eukprot:NP_001061735.1 Os08g0395500 [Oryza sativa Japonica Group]
MDNNGGGSAPTSSKRSCPFVNITNVINAKLTNKRAARLSQVKSMFQKTVRTVNRSTRTLHIRFREPQLLDLAMKITLLSLGMCGYHAQTKLNCRTVHPTCMKMLLIPVRLN